MARVGLPTGLALPYPIYLAGDPNEAQLFQALKPVSRDGGGVFKCHIWCSAPEKFDF
jgi:hypothetical protein